MGGEQSRLKETDWNTANGGLAAEMNCLCGDHPTSEKQTITLTKTNRFDSHRYFIEDGAGNILFKTQAVPGYETMFELSKNDLRFCRVKKDLKGFGWTFFSYILPAFQTQKADKEGHMEDELKHLKLLPKPIKEIKGDNPKEEMFRAYHFKFDASKVHATIVPFVDDASELIADRSDECGVPGRVILQVERVKSLVGKERYQTSLPGKKELVSYWEWHNSLNEIQAELQVAKGADLAMHVALVVLINLVKHIDWGQI